MKSKVFSILTKVASFAFVIAVVSNGAPSSWYLHQAKAPEALAKYTK